MNAVNRSEQMNTTEYLVCLGGHLTPDEGLTYKSVEPTFDKILEELHRLNAKDAGVVFLKGRIEVHCATDAATPEEAVDNVSSIIRSALHAAFIATPDFPGEGHPAWTVADLGVEATVLQPA
jgi:hypothetical protein